MAGIKDYSTTAGNNTTINSIDIAEGMAAANVNNAIRQQMADSRSFYESGGYIDLGHTPTRTGSATFTIATDVTAYYTVGTRIRCVDSSTYYGTIASSSYSSPNTTVTVTLDSGALTASLSSVAVGFIRAGNTPIHTDAIRGLSLYPKLANNNTFTGNNTFEGDDTVTGDITFQGLMDVNNINAEGSGGGALRTSGGTNCLLWGSGGSANLTAGGALSMGSNLITNVTDPSSAQDAATKAYVDNNQAILQHVYGVTSLTGSTASNVAFDSSAPQNSEGASALTQAFTPVSASSKIYINVSAYIDCSAASYRFVFLCDTSVSDCLQVSVTHANGSDRGCQHAFFHRMNSWGTSAKTFDVRYAANAGTAYLNRNASGATLGGKLNAVIEIFEVIA